MAVRHPLFARLYVPLSRLMERELGRHLRSFALGGSWVVTNPHLIGIARAV